MHTNNIFKEISKHVNICSNKCEFSLFIFLKNFDCIALRPQLFLNKL